MTLAYWFVGIAATFFLTPAGSYINSTFMNLTGIEFTDLVINIFYKIAGYFGDSVLSFFNQAFEWLPVSDGLPTSVMYAANELTPYMTTVNKFLPFDTVLLMLSILIPIQMSLWALQLGLKILGLIRGTHIDTSGMDMMAGVPDHDSYGAPSGKNWSPSKVNDHIRSKFRR